MGVTRSLSVRSSKFVVILCGILILFDGYDLVVFGNVVPALLNEPGWGFTPVVAGRIAALTLVAMAVGALVAGTLSDRFGRRAIVLGSMTFFSAAMVATALSPNVEVFEIARVVGGLGLGAMFPTVTALLMEFVPPAIRNRSYSFAFFGYLIGGVLAAGLGIVLIDSLGWRSMFWAGAFPLLLLPVIVKVLPESPAWLLSEGRRDEAETIAQSYGLALPPASVLHSPEADAAPVQSRIGALFGPRYAVATVMFWMVQFCSLLLVTGMVTWLPTIMTRLDYSLGFALAFTLALNVGAAIGAFLAARRADRTGARQVVVALFLVGAVAVSLITLRPPTIAVFVLIAAVGAGSLGAQILTNAFGASLYAPAFRGAGLGFGLAIGRIGGIVGSFVGGALLASSVSVLVIFYLLAAIAVVGALAAAVLPLTPVALEERRVQRAATPDKETATESSMPS